MAIQTLSVTFKGIDQLLLSNPQTVNSLNKYAQEMGKITKNARLKKSEEGIKEMRRIEMRAKLYWDDAKSCVFVPSSWIMASLCANSWTQIKVKKSDIRAAVFVTEWKLPLSYDGMKNVKAPADIVDDEKFMMLKILKNQASRVVKAIPAFENWSFSAVLEFDEDMVTAEELVRLLNYGAKFGGFGDFRPTYGRAIPEVTHG